MRYCLNWPSGQLPSTYLTAFFYVVMCFFKGSCSIDLCHLLLLTEYIDCFGLGVTATKCMVPAALMS